MDFDSHRTSYRDAVARSTAFAGADNDLILELKADLTVELLARHMDDPRSVRLLDVGCGIGLMDRLLEKRTGPIHGVDVSSGMLEEARTASPSTRYSLYDGKTLPFPSGAFDAALVVCVMHHVPPAQWPTFLAEVGRVVRTGGLVTVFEHNPLNPFSQLVVRRSDLDRDAVLLTPWKARSLARTAGLEIVDSKSILYFPWRGRAFRRIERGLGWIPLGGQYYVAARKRG